MTTTFLILQIQTASRSSEVPQLPAGTGSIDTISTVPYTRWDLDVNVSYAAGSQHRVRFGGFLNAIDDFDAALFAITAAEAHLMDPQQRLLLEVSYLFRSRIQYSNFHHYS